MIHKLKTLCIKILQPTAHFWKYTIKYQLLHGKTFAVAINPRKHKIFSFNFSMDKVIACIIYTKHLGCGSLTNHL